MNAADEDLPNEQDFPLQHIYKDSAKDSAATTANQYAILDQCKDVIDGIDTAGELIQKLRTTHMNILYAVDEPQGNSMQAEAERLAEEIKTFYRSLTERIKIVKKAPGAGAQRNRAQIDRAQRRLREVISAYHEMQLDLRKETEKQMARKYRIIDPDATDDKIHAVAMDLDNQQIFSEAVSVNRPPRDTCWRVD